MTDRQAHNAEQIERAVTWITHELNELPFGSTDIRFHVHNGVITRVETAVSRSVSVSSKRDLKEGGDHVHRR